MPALQWKPVLAAGICAGLVQVAAGVTMYLAGVYFAPWSGLVSLVLLAASIVVGVRWYVAHVLERQVTYVTAFLAGAGIAVVAGLVYVTYNILSVSLVYPNFLEDMARARLAAQAGSLDPSQAAARLASLRRSTTLTGVVTANLRAFCLFGTVISALAAVGFHLAFPSRSSEGTRMTPAAEGVLRGGLRRP